MFSWDPVASDVDHLQSFGSPSYGDVPHVDVIRCVKKRQARKTLVLLLISPVTLSEKFWSNEMLPNSWWLVQVIQNSDFFVFVF